jgi:hypothetical protein
MAVARPHRVVFSCCYGEMTSVALERATRSQPSTRSEATMCWVKLPRHPGRADAWPLCGPWPRPHLAASKLVELRSSVKRRHDACRTARPPRWAAHLPRVARRSLRSHRSTPGCLGVAALRLPRREAKRRRHQPRLSWGRLLRRLAAATAKSQWREETSAWGSSPSRIRVSGRSLSHANDQESHPLPDQAAARRCGGRRPVIRC